MALGEEFLPPMLRAPKPAAPALQNADFRKLLDTPRPAAGAEGGGGKPEGKPRRGGKPPRGKPRRGGDKGEEEKDKGPQYRDRAEERRKGTNIDYERVNEDIASILQGNAGLQGDISRISVEESKYLGGDVEHTHLVKGLDYSLLQKVRTEVQTDAKAAKQADEVKPQPRREEMQFMTHLGRSIYNIACVAPTANVSELFLPGRTSFVYEPGGGEGGGEVLTTLHRSKADCPPEVETMVAEVAPDVLDRLSKLMAYLQPSAGGRAGRRQRKKDRQRALEGLQTLAPFSAAPEGQPGIKQEAGPGPKPPGPTEEDNIFDDAAPYQPDAPMASASGRRPENNSYFTEAAHLPPPPPGAAQMPPPPPDGPAAGPSGPPPGYDPAQAYAQVDPAAMESYVQSQVALQASADPEYQALLARQQGGYRDEDELPGAPPGGPPGEVVVGEGGLTQQQKDVGMASVFKRDDTNLALRREGDEREKDPAFVSDAYAECYPAYHDFGTQVVDSDEEADFSQMDTQRGKGRADFETEEQWQAYKGSKESMPKAAFQFGVKSGDGRRAGRNVAKKQDAKLNTELRKIKDHLERDGRDYSKAFTAPEKPSGGSRRERAAEATPFTKKRRI